MNRKTTRLALTLVLIGTPALAGDDDCAVPMTDWQPREAVVKLAAEQGWDLRRIRIDDGCYEVIGLDAEGRAIEVKHWGARVRNDTYRGYNGYLIEAGNYKVLFSGDTAFTTHFQEIRTAKPIDLAIMPIGAYNPWIANHCNPEQAIQLADWA